MNNVIMWFVLGFAGLIFVGVFLKWFYDEYFRDTSPKSEIRPSRKNTDTSLLKQNVNHGAVGEPLLLYGNAKKKQLKNDPYRLDIPNYTASCEKRVA